ncbi:putative ribonuclease H-like domain-containing protein, partial [Tanacetum coccineum]
MKRMYCLVVTNDFRWFIWVFFQATKDKTSGILKSFITRIENLVDHKVKVIRCDNGTEFKNREMNKFCEMKGILRQYSVARTPQYNGVAERRNRTLIKATRTMLVDSKPFGCHVTILNTKDHLGKFDGKADEGFFVGYSLNSKAFRVFNSRIRIVEENLHIRFSENTPNAVESGPDWLFDIDALTRTMNYEPIVADDVFRPSSNDGQKGDEGPRQESENEDQEKDDYINSTNNVNAASDGNNTNNVNAASDGNNTNNVNTARNVNTVSSTVNVVASNKVNAVGGIIGSEFQFDPNMPDFEDIDTFKFLYGDNDEMADMNNLDTTIQVSPTPTTRIHKDHHIDQLIRDLHSATQTRKMSKNFEEYGFV